VWLIPIADERVGVQVKLWNPLRTRAIPERFCIGDSLRRGAIKCMHLSTFTLHLRRGRWCRKIVTTKQTPAVRSVTLNLANKFSQCSFSVTEHYDLFSGLIILRQAWWRRPYDVIAHRPHRTDRETAAGKAQRYQTDLKLIYMLPIVQYATNRQFRVDGHFKSVRNNRRRLYKTATPAR